MQNDFHTKSKIFIIVRRAIYYGLYILDKLLKNESDIFILCYHSIAANTWRYAVSPQMFRNQITYLEKQGYTFISLQKLLTSFAKRRTLKGKFVVITFDDGYQGYASIKKFLKSKGIKPTLFTLSNKTHVSRTELGNNLKLLTFREVKSFIKDGWEIGSHSATHANLENVSKEKVIEEVIESKKTLERKITKRIKYFAYPKGKYTSFVLSTVKKAGYLLGLTMDDEFIKNVKDPFLIPRIGVDQSHSLGEFKTIYTPSAIVFRKLIKNTFIRDYL